MARHHLEKDVLGEEPAVDISGRDQAGDCAGIIFVRGGLHVLVGIPIVHASMSYLMKARRLAREV